jgi:hypothetical protein
LFAELQAEAAERGIRLIASEDGSYEPEEETGVLSKAAAAAQRRKLAKAYR